MTFSKKIFVLAFLAASFSTAAEADWTTASNYNGYGASTQNTPSNYSMRDANGNLTLVNGQIVPSTYSATSGSQYGGGGVGTAGAGAAYGQATAIGNSLNVEVVGSHNTTIINSDQTNTGNQTATATVSSH